MYQDGRHSVSRDLVDYLVIYMKKAIDIDKTSRISVQNWRYSHTESSDKRKIYIYKRYMTTQCDVHI